MCWSSDIKHSIFHVVPSKIIMAVNAELLKILVCPLCKASLSLVNNDGGLKCSECNRIYPIRDDIPVMLASEAKIEE